MFIGNGEHIMSNPAKKTRNSIPLVALIGLPNSGKSTLLNRLTGQNLAVTADEAHTTRDVNYGEDYWEGFYIRFVDTGGLVPDPQDVIQKAVQVKSWAAIAEADVLIWVVDKRQNPETITDAFLQKLWKTGKPVVLAINKIDAPRDEKDIADYAAFGPSAFVNISAANGYNLGDLMDEVVIQLQHLGYEKNADVEKVKRFSLVDEKGEKPSKKMLEVRKNGDHYYVTREQTSTGPGLFQSVSLGKKPEQASKWEDDKLLNMSTIVFDLDGVVFQPETSQPYDGIESILHELRRQGKQLLYATNAMADKMKHYREHSVMKYFAGGLASFESEHEKPDTEFWSELCEFYEVDKTATLVFDNSEENIKSAKAYGMWGELVDSSFFFQQETESQQEIPLSDIEKNSQISSLEDESEIDDEEFDTATEDDDEFEIEDETEQNDADDILNTSPFLDILEQIEIGAIQRIQKPLNVLLLGKPNVGKSSLFNKLVGSDIQIVTDIAGTTLSINDMLVKNKRNGNEYLLLDSAGIRRKSQRTMGAETFATYRTIQAAYQADVICLVLDASKPISHQDQVIAGIAQEAHKGLVILANKADLLDADEKKRFLKDILHKMNFLKAEDFIWVSATEGTNMYQIWPKIDEVGAKRQLTVTHEQLRKLFNYLMKQKPPSKLSTKKRAVIYDLVYTRQSPPTFELLVKDKESIHWSYTRFLENIIRRQFNLSQSGLVVRLVEVNRKRVLER